jgi:hypothetical protein
MDEWTFQPGPRPRTVRAANGQVKVVPKDWELLPPGDAALTRRVKKAGETWSVKQKRGRRVFSQGVWAPQSTIKRIKAELEHERSTEQYQKKRQSDQRRRVKKQDEYVEDFTHAVKQFLKFHPRHASLGERLATAVAQHATPVGSGTVARTQRIPIERRAEAAVIAWMRHQTTAYDSMVIPRVRGKRREVRRMLAERSRQVLEQYRSGAALSSNCPLYKSLLNEG